MNLNKYSFSSSNYQYRSTGRKASESHSSARPGVYDGASSSSSRGVHRSVPSSGPEIFAGLEDLSLNSQQHLNSFFDNTGEFRSVYNEGGVVENLVDTRSVSGIPRASSQETSSSGYPGVYWDKNRKKWQACYRNKGRKIHVGLYGDKEEAYRKLREAQSISSVSGSRHAPTNISGVTWHKGKQVWVAKYAVRGKTIFVGNFQNQVDAKRALDESRAARGLPEIGSSKHTPRWRRLDELG